MPLGLACQNVSRRRRALLAGAALAAVAGLVAPATLVTAQEAVAPSPGWGSAMPPGPDTQVKITEGYARHVARDASSGRGRSSTSTTSARPPSNRPSSPTPARCRRRRSTGSSCSPTTSRRRSASSPARTRTWSMAAARSGSRSRRWWCRCRTSATASGSIRWSTCAPTASSSSARCTARRRASTCWSGRTGTGGARGDHPGVPLLDEQRLRRAAGLHGRHAGGPAAIQPVLQADHDVSARRVRRHDEEHRLEHDRAAAERGDGEQEIEVGAAGGVRRQAAGGARRCAAAAGRGGALRPGAGGARRRPRPIRR